MGVEGAKSICLLVAALFHAFFLFGTYGSRLRSSTPFAKQTHCSQYSYETPRQLCEHPSRQSRHDRQHSRRQFGIVHPPSWLRRGASWELREILRTPATTAMVGKGRSLSPRPCLYSLEKRGLGAEQNAYPTAVDTDLLSTQKGERAFLQGHTRSSVPKEEQATIYALSSRGTASGSLTHVRSVSTAALSAGPSAVAVWRLSGPLSRFALQVLTLSPARRASMVKHFQHCRRPPCEALRRACPLHGNEALHSGLLLNSAEASDHRGNSCSCCEALQLPRPPTPGRVRVCSLLDFWSGNALDEALLLFFKGPKSFTGKSRRDLSCRCCRAAKSRPSRFLRPRFSAWRVPARCSDAGEDVAEVHSHGGVATLHAIFQFFSRVEKATHGASGREAQEGNADEPDPTQHMELSQFYAELLNPHRTAGFESRISTPVEWAVTPSCEGPGCLCVDALFNALLKRFQAQRGSCSESQQTSGSDLQVTAQPDCCCGQLMRMQRNGPKRELTFRMADAGEFALRSFLNGKRSASQLQALGALLQARSPIQHRLALGRLYKSRQFESGQQEHVQWQRDLLRALGCLEAALFLGDDLQQTDAEAVMREVAGVSALVKKVASSVERRLVALNSERVIADGPRLLLLGAPNAGKSSLFNLVLGREAAIVSAVAGTTRDVHEATAVCSTFVSAETKGAFRLHIADCAGLRPEVASLAGENPVQREECLDGSLSQSAPPLAPLPEPADNGTAHAGTCDAIEGEGIRRAVGEIPESQVLLLVLDAAADPASQLRELGGLLRKILLQANPMASEESGKGEGEKRTRVSRVLPRLVLLLNKADLLLRPCAKPLSAQRTASFPSAEGDGVSAGGVAAASGGGGSEEPLHNALMILNASVREALGDALVKQVVPLWTPSCPRGKESTAESSVNDESSSPQEEPCKDATYAQHLNEAALVLPVSCKTRLNSQLLLQFLRRASEAAAQDAAVLAEGSSGASPTSGESELEFEFEGPLFLSERHSRVLARLLRTLRHVDQTPELEEKAEDLKSENNPPPATGLTAARKAKAETRREAFFFAAFLLSHALDLLEELSGFGRDPDALAEFIAQNFCVGK